MMMQGPKVYTNYTTTLLETLLTQTVSKLQFITTWCEYVHTTKINKNIYMVISNNYNNKALINYSKYTKQLNT